MTSLTRALAMALAISAFSLGAAYADDEYGTGRESLVRQSASSGPGAPLTDMQTKAAAEEFGYHGTYPVPATPSWSTSPVPSQYATRSVVPPAAPDMVGNGGAQDDMARAIHHPGSGTDW
ncbi:MAG TPA: hypothetical protein VF502_05725 [Stellaceae bacterium]